VTVVRWTEQAVGDLPAIREIIVGEYRLVYRVLPETVILLTIFRSSRLFPGRLEVL